MDQLSLITPADPKGTDDHEEHPSVCVISFCRQFLNPQQSDRCICVSRVSLTVYEVASVSIFCKDFISLFFKSADC